ncbi:MAG: nuclear transport factor 2 family protein [Proteobacteria bacterium]|nr:nuclear transport factor 2 family protein [Pseudomonadota bacterium]
MNSILICLALCLPAPSFGNPKPAVDATRSSPGEREELIAAYFRGWNDRSVDAVLALMSDDVAYQDPFSGPVRGKPAVRKYFSGLLEQFPALSLRLLAFEPEAPQCPASDAPVAVLGARYASDMTHRDGRRFRNESLDCFSFSDGKILALRAY